MEQIISSPVVADDYVTFGRSHGKSSFPGCLIAGIPTFLGANVLPPRREELEAHGVKAAVLGMPWEGTATLRPGASYGPRAIRMASEAYVSYHGEYQVDLFEALNFVDCGDVSVVPGNAARTFERAERCISEIVKAGAFPIVLGGDDSCPIPVTAALSKLIDGPMGYVQIDAHMDTAEDVEGETLNHACPVTRLCLHQRGTDACRKTDVYLGRYGGNSGRCVSQCIAVASLRIGNQIGIEFQSERRVVRDGYLTPPWHNELYEKCRCYLLQSVVSSAI